MTESSTANLFSSLQISGKDGNEKTIIVWKLEDIVNQRQLFLQMLEQALLTRSRITLKYLHKTKISREDFYVLNPEKINDTLFNTRYYKALKTYHFHFVHSEKESLTQSFSNSPLSCLLQGVFLNAEFAVRYASFFYKDGQSVLETQAYKLYLVEQVYNLKDNWEAQNISML